MYPATKSNHPLAGENAKRNTTPSTPPAKHGSQSPVTAVATFRRQRRADGVVLGARGNGRGGGGGNGPVCGRRSSKTGPHFIACTRFPLTLRRRVMKARPGSSSPAQTSAKSASERCRIASTCPVSHTYMHAHGSIGVV